MGRELAPVYCPLCGEKVAFFDVDRRHFDDSEYFLNHLEQAHRFTSAAASTLVDNLENSLDGGIGA